MGISLRSSGKSVDGSVAAAIKKPTVLIISEKDPRNSKDYIKSFPGTIKVLSEKEFSMWLSAEYADPGSDGYYEDGTVLNASVENTLYGQIDNAIKPPENLAWNKKDIHYITSDNEIFQNITITFDESPTDDGTYEYHVFYQIQDAPQNQSQVPTAKGATNTIANVSNVKTITRTSSTIKLSWNQLASVDSYEVLVQGTNIPGTKTGKKIFLMPAAGGRSVATILCTGAVLNGVYSWTLVKSGTDNFSGVYSITIKAIYKSTASTGVNKSVTIV